MDRKRRTNIVVALLGFAAVVITAIFGVLVNWVSNQLTPSNTIDLRVSIIAAVATIVVGLLGTVAAIYSSREAGKESEIEKQKIAEAASKLEKQPEKARPAWDLARITLDSYFNRNLSQITYIFWFSVFVMSVGFAVIIWGIFQAIRTPDTIAPATISVLAGVVTEFLGATFIFIYRSTIQQALNYTKALERINSVGMAMQILDTMPDETQKDDLKSKTKAVLVELLVKQAHESSKENSG